MAFRLVITIKQRVCFSFHALQKRFLCWVKPPTTSLVLGAITDLLRGKKETAANNRTWGAERIRGELLKLDIRVSKRTIQKYRKQVCLEHAPGQTWKTFLHNHATEIWACDFLQVTDLFFRPLFAFFIIELKSRKIIHVHVTHPFVSLPRRPCHL